MDAGQLCASSATTAPAAEELPPVRNTKKNRQEAIKLYKQLMEDPKQTVKVRADAEAAIITLEENTDKAVVKTILGQVARLKQNANAESRG